MRAGLHITRRLSGTILSVLGLMWSLAFVADLLPELLSGEPAAGRIGDLLLGATLYGFDWATELLPILLLVGAILGILGLQRRRELVILKTSGQSIWQIVAIPVLAAFTLGVLHTFVLSDRLIDAERTIEGPTGVNRAQFLRNDVDWFLVRGNGLSQHVRPGATSPSGDRFEQLAVYVTDDQGTLLRRLSASFGRIVNDRLLLSQATLQLPGEDPIAVETLELDGRIRPEDIRLARGASASMKRAELHEVSNAPALSPTARTVARMAIARAEALPFMLVGTLLIAFAFTSGYRRTGASGVQILYGILLGLAVYVISGLAQRAGSSGVLDTTLAAWGPALAAIVIGVTVLLHTEDG